MINDQDRFHILNPRTLLKRFEFGSVVIAPYVVAVVWQYFCTFEHGSLAWTLTALVSAVVWVFYLSLSDDSSRLSWHFWLLVALPLLFFYLIRLPFPDVSFDVLNYHIFHSERALRGPLLMPGDFFPTPAPFNPTPDILTGLYRYAFGYRLGTVANLLALIWTATIVNRILRDWIDTAWLRSLAIFAVVATEQLLFQVNNYMVDLLALPLLLEATRIALKTTGERLVRQTTLLSLLLGMAATFKLANLIYAVPIIVIYVFNILAGAKRSNRMASLWRLAKFAPVASVVFVLPLLPFTILICRLTGNPVFPLYNGLFKSPFWPQGALFDPRWGPYGFIETVSWPVVIFFRPARLSEYPFYSGRLSIGFVVVVALILLARRNRMIWQLAFITLIGAIVWSASSGYIRYALYLELTSGILIVWLVAYLWKKLRETSRWRGGLIITPLALLLLLHFSFALAHGYRWEWSGRATVFERPLRDDLGEAANLLRDRSLARYIAPEDMSAFQNVDCWIETTYKTSAFAGLLKPKASAIGVRLGEYFLTPVARRRFTDVLNAHQGQRIFTLTDRENYDKARADLSARGLVMENSRPVSIYYFSRSLKFDLLLVEVAPKEAPVRGPQQVADRGVPLPDSAFNAKLSVVTMPATLHAGQKYDLRIALKNESTVTWPGSQPTWQFQLTVGNRWLKQSGEKVTDTDARAPLFDDLPGGSTVELSLTVTAPSQPGIYILQLDAIQESVAWFGERGSEVLSLKVKVE